MGIRAVTPSEAVELACDVLGLDPGRVDLTSVEFLAASLRRVASFLCPIAPRLLVRSVEEVLAGLPGYCEDTTAVLDATVEALALYGDLLELPVEEEDIRRRHLYLGPPAFILRESGVVLLLGVRPEGAPLISGPLSREIEYDVHARKLPTSTDDTREELIDDGLIQIQPEQWLRSPSPQSPDQVIEAYAARVWATRAAGPLETVRVLDPTRPPTFYRGRWRDLTQTDTGVFVGRRSQGYGADLWCFLEVRDGEVGRGVDLPVHEFLGLGADEAWRLQAAIDAERGHPQRVSVRPASRDGWSVIDLFSPIPSWAQRRLDIVATPILKSPGALLSYSVPTAELAEEIRFLEEMMWLKAVTSDVRADE